MMNVLEQESQEIVRYLTTHDRDLLWGLVISTVGYQVIGSNRVYPTMDHPSAYRFNYQNGRVFDEFQIVYVSKGGGIFESAHQTTVSVEEGTIIFLFPSEWHRYKPNDSCGWTTYWVGFQGEFAKNILDKGFLSVNHPLLDVGYDEEIVRLFRQLIDGAKAEKSAFQNYLAGIVIHLLGYLIQKKSNIRYEDPLMVEKIDKARLLIRERVDQNCSPESIAVDLNMTYSWFRQLFKQYTGMSPAKYIAQIRLQRAKEFLSGSTRTVKEIAITMNFESADYFSTQFKRMTGMTPGQYRKFLKGE